MSTNGNEIPPEVLALGRNFDELYLVRMLASCLVGFWRLVYWLGLPATGMLVYCSTPWNVMYGLSRVAPWKLKVLVLASTSVWEEAVIWRLFQVPNRQCGRHRPALGRSVGAVLGAVVEHRRTL